MPVAQAGFTGIATGAAMAGLKPHLRIHDLQLCNASHRSDHQLSSKDSVHVSRNHLCSHCLPRSQWCSCWRGCPALAVLCSLVQPCAWPEGKLTHSG